MHTHAPGMVFKPLGFELQLVMQEPTPSTLQLTMELSARTSLMFNFSFNCFLLFSK